MPDNAVVTGEAVLREQSGLDVGRVADRGEDIVHAAAMDLSMKLFDAVEGANVKAVRALLKQGAKPTIDELQRSISGPIEIMRALVEHTKPSELAKKKDGSSLLLSVGFEIRSAYPNPERLRRSKDPDAPEPAPIVDLRKKAELLRAAGAPVDFGAAAMLGYGDIVEAMLAKDPKLATKKVFDQSISDLAAWAGAWHVTRMLKDARSGKAFDWNKLGIAVYEWALKSLKAFAKKHKSEQFRLVGFDVNGPDVLLIADLAAQEGSRPGNFSHGEIANFDKESLSEPLVRELEKSTGERELAEYFAALVQAASLLEADASLELRRSEDFMVLVFDHDDDVRAALARRRKAAPGKKAPAAKASGRRKK